MKSQVFHDFDAFAESVRDVDCEMLMQNVQSRVWSNTTIELDKIDLQLGTVGSGNIVQGQVRKGGSFLYLPLSNKVEYSINGTLLERDAFGILEPGSEFCVSTKVEHDWCAMFVPNQLLDGSSDFFTTRTCRVTAPNRRAAKHFRSIAREIEKTASRCPEFESSPAAKESARAELLRVATSILDFPTEIAPSTQAGRPKLSRKQIVDRSLELVGNDYASVSVKDLANRVNVCERTLRTAFISYFGIGPTRYFRLRQLHRIHRTLRSADPDESKVSQILVDHGEWSFGRFAARYRNLFGELPSETLRKIYRP